MLFVNWFFLVLPVRKLRMNGCRLCVGQSSNGRLKERGQPAPAMRPRDAGRMFDHKALSQAVN